MSSGDELMVVGKVDLRNRLGQGHQAVTFAGCRREEVREVLSPCIECQPDHIAQPAHAQPFGERIDRSQSPGAHQGSIQRLKLGAAHDEAASIAFDFAAERVCLSDAQLFFDPGIEPGHLHLAGAVAHAGRDQFPVTADVARFDVPDRTDDGCLLTELEPVYGAKLAVVVVTMWQEVQEIAHGLHAQLGELMGVGRADVGQADDG